MIFSCSFCFKRLSKYMGYKTLSLGFYQRSRFVLSPSRT